MKRTPYLERYQVVADDEGTPVEIRRDGNGVTYQAADVASGGEVALELIAIRDLSPETEAEREEEARVAQDIAHINLPRLLAFGRDEDHLVYASEYFNGTSAEAWVGERGPMPIGPVLRIGLQVVSALSAAAAHGIVHGAINPRNILLVPGQTAQGEWPLIKMLRLIGPAPSFGAEEWEFTAEFVSPEQMENGTVDFRAEVYSLGATLWFLLTGAAVRAREARTRASSLPKPVLELFEEMLARDPEERPSDPAAFEGRLRNCLEQAERRETSEYKLDVAMATSIPGIPTMRFEPRRTFPWRPLAVAAVLVLFAGLLAFFLPANLRPTQLFSGAEEKEPLGVPIGVSPAEQTVADVAAPVAPSTEPSPAVETVAAATQPSVEATPEPAPSIEVAPAKQVAVVELPKTEMVETPKTEPVSEAPLLASAFGEIAAEPPHAVAVAETEIAATVKTEPLREPEPAPLSRAFGEIAISLPVAEQNIEAPGEGPETISEPPVTAAVEHEAIAPPPAEKKEARPAPVVVARAQQSVPPPPPSHHSPVTINGLPVRRAEPVADEEPSARRSPVVKPAKPRKARPAGVEGRPAEPANGPAPTTLPKSAERFIRTTSDGELVLETAPAEPRRAADGNGDR